MKRVSDPLAVYTSGEVTMGEKQAQFFAVSIFASVKTYISDHRVEYEAWLREQENEVKST